MCYYENQYYSQCCPPGGCNAAVEAKAEPKVQIKPKPVSQGGCTTDADCGTGLSCVIQADGYYSQCVDCSEPSFDEQCGYWSTQILEAAFKECGISSCPGKCPGGTDAECPTGETCVQQDDDGSYNDCINCADFASECTFWGPSFLSAALAACNVESCAGACPNGLDSECPTGEVCVQQDDDGAYSNCIDCADFATDCDGWTTSFLRSAEAKCEMQCPGKCPNGLDSECPSDEVCVVQDDDGAFSDCINCANFTNQCQFWTSQFLVAAEAKCGEPKCPGKCPEGSDAECPTGEVCVAQSNSNYNDCIDCTDFANECFYWTPSFLSAAEAKCGATCAGRCPDHTDAECPSGSICVVQADGNFDQCVDCTATTFQSTCKYWSEGILTAAEAACGEQCTK